MDGQTVVVTGATRGVGREAAAEFAGQGADVVICARDPETVEATAAELDTDVPGSVIGQRADVRDEYDLERLMQTAAEHGAGGIDVVVANAAVFHGEPGDTPVTGESYSAFDDSYQTNVRGVFGTLREAVPHLAEGARLLVPSGGVARDAKPGIGGYAVSKAGAEAVARQFHVDTDADTAAFVLDLGLVATELTGEGSGRDPERVSEMFTWAAGEAEPEEHGGEVIDLRTWKRASR
ncbi:MAG: dehydrogenase [halophilic archaeon J07HB67]|jgi:Dehydrogenases with different specificities (related to short-chain alcohol dehydrogenases)|nr:MAG: dehydrogenase [halophilic archaeon J07HB67]